MDNTVNLEMENLPFYAEKDLTDIPDEVKLFGELIKSPMITVTYERGGQILENWWIDVIDIDNHHLAIVEYRPKEGYGVVIVNGKKINYGSGVDKVFETPQQAVKYINSIIAV
jgi:hypothetical protein